MQSVHNFSLDFLNRKHTFENVETAINILSERGINICLHIILGIPGEYWNDIMETAEIVSSLKINGIKLHHLHVLKNTTLEKMYLNNEIKLLSSTEYFSLVCDFLERTRQDIVIHRLSGDANINHLIAPKWGLLKGSVQQGIIDEFKRRNSFQGFLIK